MILTEFADLVFEGMTIAGYAIGAKQGILYLRGEYTYLRRTSRRCSPSAARPSLLGKNVRGKQGFDFDIRIRMGAGAYVCGEETALIESLEGYRGEPRNRPPFPVNTGFLGRPTTVNNVETLAWVACILAKGADWFKTHGHRDSPPASSSSASPATAREPGVYEFPLGITVAELLEAGRRRRRQGRADRRRLRASASRRGQFDRTIAFEDIPTGGSIIVFGPQRDMLDVRAELPGVLRRRVLRPVHALPRGQRASCSKASSCCSEGRCSMAYLQELLRPGRDHAARLQVRPRPEQPQRLPLHRQALPATRSWAAPHAHA